ncbi:hypothetical protein RO22_19710 [Halomonas sp. KHS3]|nr:hypothetical protein RO22_19710 [Halomonas sp. KHS3]
MIFSTFQFDDSVSDDIKAALKPTVSVSFNPTNLLVGDHVRLYPKGSEEGHMFECTARRHEMTPDEHGDSQLVFVLSAI